MSKELRALIKAARAQGFTVERTRSGHWLVRNAEGRAVATISGTASDYRSWLNSLARLRQVGFVWPHRRR